MLSPQEIAALQDAAAQISVGMTEALIRDMAQRIAAAGKITATADYELYRAQALGNSRRAIKKMLKKELKLSSAEIDRLFRKAGKTSYHAEAAGIPGTLSFAENTSVQQMVKAAAALAKKDFTNLTQTLGMVAPDGHAYPVQKTYQKCMDYAFEQVFTGSADFTTAVRQATRSLADKGLRTIDYASGVHTSIEAATRRCVLGGMGLMVEQISSYNHNTLGCNGWEISAHANSAPDHEPIQGKQYSDAAYKALNESLARRIGTLNCGHAAFPIILGVNSPQYTQQELEDFKTQNAQGFSYQGRHYTGYEASQKQRQLERSIRAIKRRVLTADATGDEALHTAQSIRLNRLNEEYRRFSSSAGLRTKQNRLETAGWSRSAAGKATAAMHKAGSAANTIFSLGGTAPNVDAYLKDKLLIDTLFARGVKYKQRMNANEIIVEAGKPTIARARLHAIDNLEHKADRAGMTTEQAQAFVDGAKLTLYRQDAETLKFMAQDGYSILNFDHELVTAVPQKWRKKFDQYIEEVSP